MSKSITQLESLNRELQERNRILENSKSQMDKDYYQLQAVLEANEETEVMILGRRLETYKVIFFLIVVKQTLKLTVLAIFSCTIQWHKVQSCVYATITAVPSPELSYLPRLKVVLSNYPFPTHLQPLVTFYLMSQWIWPPHRSGTSVFVLLCVSNFKV